LQYSKKEKEGRTPCARSFPPGEKKKGGGKKGGPSAHSGQPSATLRVSGQKKKKGRDKAVITFVRERKKKAFGPPPVKKKKNGQGKELSASIPIQNQRKERKKKEGPRGLHCSSAKATKRPFNLCQGGKKEGERKKGCGHP